MPVISGGKIIEGAQRRASFAASEGGFAGAGMLVARANYSFAVEGGAVSTIGLTGATGIPSGAYIMGGFLEVTSALTSGGSATVAVQVEAANDIITATAFGSAPWSSTGRKSIIPVFTGATNVKTTAARDISVVIGTAALTAGVFSVFLFYIAPDV